MHSGLQSPTYRRVRARTCVRFTTANQYQGVMTQTAAVAATTAAVAAAAILCRDEVLYVRCASILRRKLFVCMRWTRLLAPPTLNSPARQSAIALENDTRIQVYTRCLLASLPSLPPSPVIYLFVTMATFGQVPFSAHVWLGTVHVD